MKKLVWCLCFMVLLSGKPLICGAASQVVYLDGSAGNDTFDGSGNSVAVKSFERAKELLDENGTILISGTVTVTSDAVYTLAEKGSSARVRRAAGFTDPMFLVDGSAELVLTGITIDGNHESSANSSYLRIGENASCVIGDNTLLCNSSLRSMANGSVDNSGMLRMEGGVISGECSTLIRNMGTTVINGGQVVPGVPPAGRYYYAVTNWGNLTVGGGEIGGTDAGGRTINQQMSKENSLVLKPGAVIHGKIILQTGTWVTIDGNLPPQAQFVLEPENGLVGSWAENGAVLVRPRGDVVLSTENFVCTDTAFVLVKSRAGELILRDPALPDFVNDVKSSSFFSYESALVVNVGMSVTNHTGEEQACVGILAVYAPDGKYLGQIIQKVQLKPGETMIRFDDFIPDAGRVGGTAKVLIWDGLERAVPLCKAVPIHIPAE